MKGPKNMTLGLKIEKKMPEFIHCSGFSLRYQPSFDVVSSVIIILYLSGLNLMEGKLNKRTI